MVSLNDRIHELMGQWERLRDQRVNVPEVREGSLMQRHHVRANMVAYAEPPDIESTLKQLAADAAATQEYHSVFILGGIHFTTKAHHGHGTKPDGGHVTFKVYDSPASSTTTQTLHMYVKHSSGQRLLVKRDRPSHYRTDDIVLARPVVFARQTTPLDERIAKERAAQKRAQDHNAPINRRLDELRQEIARLTKLLSEENAAREHKRHDRRDDDDNDDDHGHGGGGIRIKGIASRDQGFQIKGRAAADQGLRIKGTAQHHGQRRTKK